MNKKAQGLSLTTIIVAAVGLIVLVVLVAIFTGQMASFGIGISRAAKAELATLKLDYSTCHPSRGMETRFLADLDKADEGNRAVVINSFERAISSCASQGNEDSCETHFTGEYEDLTCAWG
ncbi:hypothetical protein KY342_03585 [Candidatus Woesearchaeota archaeon]|nr:hypothetical protein [Candidatus Woesearchaeota archaeon]